MRFPCLKFLAIVALVALIGGGVWGLSRLGGMKLHVNGTMSGCIFDGKAEICTMSIFRHISAFQGAFTTSHLPKLDAVLLLSSLVVFVVSLFVNASFAFDNTKTDASSKKLYATQHPDIPLFNTLQLAFSQGILNPKIY